MNLRKHAKKFYGLSAIALLLILMYVYLVRYWPIKVIKFKGSYHHAQASEIQAQLEPLIPDSMFELKVDALKVSVEALPWIKSASVRRLWPDTLLIYFEEHLPFVKWCQNGILTRDKTYISVANDSNEYQSLPVLLCGPEGTEHVVLNEYNRLKKELSRVGLDILSIALTERYSWQLELTGGLKLELGRENTAERMNHFVQHWQHIKANLPAAAEIDLRYPNGIAVRKS